MSCLASTPSTKQSNPRARHLSQRGGFDAAQKARVRLPRAAPSNKSLGSIDDGAAGNLICRPCRIKPHVQSGDLLGFEAVDIQKTIWLDFKNGESRVHHPQRRAIDHLDHDAGLAHTLSSKVGNTGQVLLPKQAHERRAGQRVQRVVSGQQEYLR